MPQPYVSRPEAEAFLAALADGIQAPQASPVVFHLWGIGGVGKSTLLRQVVATFTQAAIPLVNQLPMAFGTTEGIDHPADLMKKLHGRLEPQFLNPSLFGRNLRSQPDPFTERYTQYFDAIHQLNSTAPDGKSGASAEQLSQVKQLLKGLTQGGGALATMTGNPVVGSALVAASQGTGAVVEGASLALSEKDRIQGLVQSHRATRDKRDLQELLLDPLPHLTQAFVKSLGQWSAQKPIILMLDTYEKADLATTDPWLWRTLLSNTEVRRYPIRLVVAGRYNLLNRPEWQTVQQTSELVKPYGPKKFTPAQTQDYLAKIGIADPATVDRIHQVTKGWPYYLNKIRETQPSLNPEVLTQDLATFLVNHLPPAEQTAGKQLAQLAACCRWFDGPMIESLAQQFQLVPPLPQAGLAPGQAGCLTWLKEQTFVEPLSSGRWRLDDVARDVFRMAQWQDDRPRFERIHDLLARYFKAKSNQAAAAKTPTSIKYDNPEWRESRAEYLYHLSFTPSAELKTIWLSHVLEANYLSQADVVRAPLQSIVEDYTLAEHPHLAYATRTFLQRLTPAIEHGGALLGEASINYSYIKSKLGLDRADVDQTIETCLYSCNQLEGFAQFAALFYKYRRCLDGHKILSLRQAKIQAEQLSGIEEPLFLAKLLSQALGASFSQLNLFEESLSCHQKAVEVEPNCYEGWSNKGAILNNLGHYESAIEMAKNSLKIRHDYFHAFYVEGYALAQLKFHAEAIACFNRTLENNPNYYPAIGSKGTALYALGEKAAAIACYDTALAIKSDYHEALYNKGNVLSALGEKAAAIACYDAALAIKPDYHEALTNKGTALSALGEKAAAIACYDAALAIKPDKHEALTNKGTALSALGEMAAAIACYDAALAIKPDDHKALTNKGTALYDLGKQTGALAKLSEGIACYDAALAIKPDDHEALYNKGVALSALGDQAAAIACYDAALAIKPDFHEALQGKSNIYFADGQLDKALVDFDRALDLQPENQSLIVQRSLVLLQMGDSSQLATAQKAIAAVVADPKFFKQMQQNLQKFLAGGLSETQKQHMQQVMASLNPQGGPLDTDALQAQIQDYQDFVAEYQELIQKSPGAWGHFMSAATAMVSNDIETTITQLQAAVELVPEYRDLLRDDPDSWPDDLRTDERFRALVEGE